MTLSVSDGPRSSRRRARLPNAEHRRHPWLLHSVASDFALLDVWSLPVEGGRDDFPAFLEAIRRIAPAERSLTYALFRIRLRLGALFGWDVPKPRPIPGCAGHTLAARLPDRLRAAAGEPALLGPLADAAGGFRILYRTGDELAAEISNATVHAVAHFGWVARGAGRFGAQMAVLVKPRGVAGRAYMRLIQPFRHRIVYPALLEQTGRAWQKQPRTPTAGP